jgi:hypothetical protein
MLGIGNMRAWQPGHPNITLCLGLYGLPRITQAACESLPTLLGSMHKSTQVYINSWYRETEIPKTWHSVSNMQALKNQSRQLGYFSLFGENLRLFTIQCQRDFDSSIPERSNLLNQALSISHVSADILRTTELDGIIPEWVIITRQDVIFTEPLNFSSLEKHGIVYTGGHNDPLRGGQLNSEDLTIVFPFEHLRLFVGYFKWVAEHVGRVPYNPIPVFIESHGLIHHLHPNLEFLKNMFIDRSYAL